ncbi:MAG TPA: bifunctional phosphoribosylaminoimidazolecarboxamide formyltransferase/inosine monophosphate cyclohydrolase, partial [Phycisphaerales bacterium]|nr:bifunctional phosphoribosylaminoimidazolecarboxamide formyltransferase/inosine monophosphate cyclohydrolase [Phycisphaerales bacterium]
HANPCGASVAPGAREAVALAMAGDPVAAYGGIVAVCTPGGAALEETDVAALTEKGVFL